MHLLPLIETTVGFQWINTGLCANETSCVLPSNPLKSRSREIESYNDRIALKFDRYRGAIAQVPIKFESDLESLNPNLAGSSLRENLR